MLSDEKLVHQAPPTPAQEASSRQFINVIRPPLAGVGLNLREVWDYLDLLFLLIWRDVKVRYKQTIVGATWALLQPFIMMFVLSIFFGWFVGIQSEDIPYPIFVYSALVPWTFFVNVLVQSSHSVINNHGLVTKIYFPRLILPMVVAGMGLVDFIIAFIMILGLMFFYGLMPTLAIWTLPLFLILTLMTALGFGLWLAALNVEYRDIAQIVPFMTQVWFFATPIAYPSSTVPEPWRFVYSLNPMVGVIEGFRWALLGKAPPSSSLLFVSVLVAVLVLVTGLYFFRYKEDSFADVI